MSSPPSSSKQHVSLARCSHRDWLLHFGSVCFFTDTSISVTQGESTYLTHLIPLQMGRHRGKPKVTLHCRNNEASQNRLCNSWGHLAIVVRLHPRQPIALKDVRWVRTEIAINQTAPDQDYLSKHAYLLLPMPVLSLHKSRAHVNS